MANKFSAVFGTMLKGDVYNAFADTVMHECKLDIDTRSLSIRLFSDAYITDSMVSSLKLLLKEGLKLNDLKLSVVFDEECFGESALSDVASILRKENAAVNGYLNGARYIVSGNSVTVDLNYGGGKTLKEIGFADKLKLKIKNLFGLDVNVELSGQLGEVPLVVPSEPVVLDEPPLPEPLSDYGAPPPIKEEPVKIKAKKGTVISDGLPEFLTDFEIFYGNKIEGGYRKMATFLPPSYGENKVTVSGWGEVFDFDTRDLNTKRGPMKLLSFCLSDYTNSVFCKMFVKPEVADTLGSIKNGKILVFSGDYSYDSYLKDYFVQPRALATAKKILNTDEAEEKRVELHCHTNMSMKDAVSSAENLINCAYRWGHKAIAITDHGVVQSYPAAADAVKGIRKSGGEFKVIYGVEGYFADDTLGETDIKKLKTYHQIILVKNLVGLKNLYKLVSESHINDFYKRPVIRKSKLVELREGLIIGSACEAGDLYSAVIDGKSMDELIKIAEFYDYLEIQPVGNNAFMVRDSSKEDKVNKKTGEVIKNRFRHVVSEEVIRDFNRKIVEIGDRLNKPVVATGDVHFMAKEDEIIRKILMAAQGYEDFDLQAPLYLHTTDEMLAEFNYFGDRAKEFVVDNPNKIADMIDETVVPVPPGNYPPVIEGSDETLREICWERAKNMYGFGGEVPDLVKERLSTELDGIINNGYSIMYIAAQKLVSFSEENGYLVGSRGSVGSSFVATMAGISEVNPLPPHYYCPKCRFSEFFSSKVVGSGFDLPEKNCPHCGTALKRDGHDIPFATFLGFKGDKVPDIDLNFSDLFQNEVQKYTESLFGAENVFKAGTISTIAEKTAFGFVKAYCELKEITLSSAEMNRLAKLVENSKIKVTTGQHPAGMIVVPRDKTIYDFCPIQHPADDVNSDILTTHFDFHSIHDTILKLDELGHVVPTTYKYLEEYSGIPVNDVTMSDPAVYSLFVSTDALGVSPEQIDSQTGTFCLPEFGTQFVRGMLMDARPKNFSDLLQISGLSHGTDVWLGNAKDLIDNGTCTISEVIGTRDNIMIYLINQGMDNSRAFKITETVRKGLVAKGKVSKDDWLAMEEDMRAVEVPEWYIESCKKIKYMFPKAHAAAYVISALRLAWYKVHRPLEFYCAYFSARPEDVDAVTIMKGHDAVKRKIIEIKERGKEAGKKELDVMDNLYIFNEMMSRGVEILPIDINKSHAVKFLPEDGKMRLPFGSITGMGDKAAYSVYETAQKGEFISVEDFQMEAGISKTLIQTMVDLGVMGDLPETNQMSMF